ncbi:hypothetical protein HQ590_01080 [bacterium]|nr:hypothetical protein [bacterium]
MRNVGDPPDGDTAPASPSVFKYVIGASCLFIAGCSAYFSVKGLGMLFIGGATAVMALAASLEIGKLVAASFLYRYWREISAPFRVYLTAAVVILIAVTSLGIYGYLARAYERTHTKISAYEQQIAAIEAEIADSQARIDASRRQLGTVADTRRGDIDQTQQRLLQASQSFEQSLARLQERRGILQSQRDQDLAVLQQQLDAETAILNRGLETEVVAIATLNDQLAVLDRAVDAYTALGGPGLFKVDSIKKGQELLDKQKTERQAIALTLATRRARQAELPAEHAERTAAINAGLAAVGAKFADQFAKLDTEETQLREAHAGNVARVEQQVGAMQSTGETVLATGGAEIEALYQRIRRGQQEIRHLQAQIAATDIGSYRFVARAFGAPADDVVKWLMLALVAVIDPLAVTLAVGFNVALLNDVTGRRRRRTGAPPAARSEETASIPGNGDRRGRRSPLVTAGGAALGLVLGAGLIGLIGHLGWQQVQQHRRTTHAKLIPSDSFAVIAIDPTAIERTSQTLPIADWLKLLPGNSGEDLRRLLAQSGFEPTAYLYAFAKYPTDQRDRPADRPVMIAGLVARVSNTAQAEQTLSALADEVNRRLRPTGEAYRSLTKNRAMIRSDRGRFMDPEGGFFTFGISDGAAIVMVEIEGDPAAPCIEAEIRRCLREPDAETITQTVAAHDIPPAAVRASSSSSATLWFDAQRYFSQLPKNAAAQTRYSHLQRHLDFDLLVTADHDENGDLQVVAEYAYGVERFQTPPARSALETLAAVGPATTAGLPGQLMDRCADTLDYDSLIARLRQVFTEPTKTAADQVVVEKSIDSTRAASFILTAHYDRDPAKPATAALGILPQ